MGILSDDDIKQLTSLTIQHYELNAKAFWEGTKDHDVTQNYEAFLHALPKAQGLKILDLGCGPGRDVLYFRNQGHQPVGLDACEAFCQRAREYTGCPIWRQDFLELQLEANAFDGIFANASLFHVPRRELKRVLGELNQALKPQGILFSSNPRGNGESFDGSRYGNYMEFELYEKFLNESGFQVLSHYYRPAGLPRSQQPWLAVVSRKILKENS